MSKQATEQHVDNHREPATIALVESVLEREFAILWTTMHDEHNKQSAEVSALYRDIAKAQRRVARLQKKLTDRQERELFDVRDFRNALRAAIEAGRSHDPEQESNTESKA